MSDPGMSDPGMRDQGMGGQDPGMMFSGAEPGTLGSLGGLAGERMDQLHWVRMYLLGTVPFLLTYVWHGNSVVAVLSDYSTFLLAWFASSVIWAFYYAWDIIRRGPQMVELFLANIDFAQVPRNIILFALANLAIGIFFAFFVVQTLYFIYSVLLPG